MKLKNLLLAAALLFSSGLILPSTALAASEDECAIWLCLPGGFPSGCGAAHSAMVDRVKNFKPPLPPFPSCVVNPSEGGGSSSTMTSSHGVAAYIPAHQECLRHGYSGDRLVCNSYRSVPERRVRGVSCTTHHESGIRTPEGCTRTDRYATVFIDGQQQGETYWW